MPRRSLALVVVLGTCLALAAPAGAVKPDKEPAPFAEATGAFCDSFSVHIRATTDRGKIKVFSTGAAMITGALKVEVTNLETGSRIDLNFSGPARFSADGTTLVGTGRWLFSASPGSSAPALRQLSRRTRAGSRSIWRTARS